MRFRQHQDEARQATRRLLALFVLTVVLTVLCVNGALALIWRLQFGGIFGYPQWFFETNTLVALGFILGGSWLESLQLREGGAHVAKLVGGRELVTPDNLLEKRLRNIVDEMAIASGLKPPRVFVLDREDGINAFAAGWEQQDSVIAVTRGALERLTRDELQGVVAHEFAHILNGDTRLNMRLIGHVYGLQLIFNFGRSMTQPVDDAGRRGAAALMGYGLMAVGSIGWAAGRLLKAAVSRQREFLADAYAVQFTRLADGIGGALRKIAGQVNAREEVLRDANAEVISHLWLSSAVPAGQGWFATHPPLRERLFRIYGRAMPPLPFDVQPLAESHASPVLPPLAFVEESETQATQHETPPLTQQPSVAVDNSLLQLGDMSMPGTVQAALLAFLVPPDAASELEGWRTATGATPEARRMLHAVQTLSAGGRMPWFDHVLGQAATLSQAERIALCGQAVSIVRADGRLSLQEYLLALLIRRQLSPHPMHLGLERRHWALPDVVPALATTCLAIAGLMPAPTGQSWCQAVFAGLGLKWPADPALPDHPAALAEAIEQLRSLSISQRPMLAKQWLAATVPEHMEQPVADALRIVCMLLDTPLPVPLAERFDNVPHASRVETQLSAIHQNGIAFQ